MRFRCLHKSSGHLSFRPNSCANVIVATSRLHNKCILQIMKMSQTTTTTRGTIKRNGTTTMVWQMDILLANG